MIHKTAHGYMVVSEEGKPLSKPDLSLQEAKHRLAQVEYFKHQGQAGHQGHQGHSGSGKGALREALEGK